MKFFTRAWTQGNMTDDKANAVAPAYWRRVEMLDLPRSVRDLATLNPHDAHILHVEHDQSAGTLCLRLRCGDLQAGYFDAALNFSGVIIRPAHLATLVKAMRPAPFEILYDEVDRANATAFEYRLLLHSALEVVLQFRDVAVARQRVANRHAV